MNPTPLLPVEVRLKLEKTAIKLVMVGDAIMAILGFAFFYATYSHAILMDAVYPFIDLIAALLTLRVVSLFARQTRQPESGHHFMGYAVFEPVLNFIKGILILGVILVAFYASVKALFTGGRMIDAHTAVFYSVLASLINFGLAWYLHRLNKLARSSLIEVDLQGWLIGGWLSVAVGLSFALAIWLENLGWYAWLPYTDPVVVVILILVILPMPLKILKENGLQIVRRSGNSDTGRAIKQRIVSALEGLTDRHGDLVSPEQVKMRYLQMGRMVYVQAYVLVPVDAEVTLAQQDAARARAHQALAQQLDYFSLDLVFTQQAEWLA
ncbi:MAG: cation transporter [Hydrogenovibrio sp.]|uniref:cation transporter n=1 Tax=Hydrogenovibrio sp. TaxID=2065821 RepID=UPI002870AFB2|nr:cation transporter [Hydrogenovibrio sp.]MDR9498711.1 cation transporter [Hydrogenovibrio sp.]